MDARPHDDPAVPVPPHLAFLRRWIWVIAAVLAMVTLAGLRPFLRRVPEAPAVLYALPGFEGLVTEQGQPFTRGTLAGQVWVASFIFTSCPSSCPAVTRAMKSLEDRYAAHDLPVRLVSFTVDPATDSPEVLRAYGERVGADPRRWTFVTGELTRLRELLEGGFHLGVGDKRPVDGGLYDIAHSTKLALVDPDGGVRGYYGIDEPGLDEIFHRSQHVLRDYARAARR